MSIDGRARRAAALGTALGLWLVVGGTGCAIGGAPAVDPTGRAVAEAAAAPTLPDPSTRWAAAPDDRPRPTEADRRWWTRLGDEALSDAVERALARNADIALARSRVAEARAALREAQSRRSPRLQGTATVEAVRRDGGDASGSAAVAPALALQLDWDADLWGTLDASERAGQARLAARADEVQAVRLSVAALTARSLLAWREARADAAVQRRSLDLLADTARVVRVRVEAGLAPRLDRLRVDGELAAAEAALTLAIARERDALRALQLLTGEAHPGGASAWRPAIAQDAGDALADPAAAIDAALAPPPLNLPIDLLHERPDLRAARRELQAARADLDAAEAARRPSLRLPGLLTLGSAASGDWLARLTASIALQAAVPLADGGERRAARDAALARVQAAEVRWQRAVQAALAQAEAALSTRELALRAMTAQAEAVRAAEAAEGQARVLYDNGLTGLLDLLDVQRSALLRRQALLRQRADAGRATVSVFEAMGLVTGPAES